MRAHIAAVFLALAVAAGGSLFAEVAYFREPLRDLPLVEGSLPDWRSSTPSGSRAGWTQFNQFVPFALLDSPGEVYVEDPWEESSRFVSLTLGALVIRLDVPGDAKGRLFVPAADWSRIVALRFVVPSAQASADARPAFLRAKHEACEALAARGVPGAAWFRHLADSARREAPERDAGDIPSRERFGPVRPRPSELEETYAVFTGGRALAEKLQLDRLLPPLKDADFTVDVSKLQGIAVAAIDWKPLVQDLKPALDPLAAAIPEDQHAIFLPSFRAMVGLMDEADASGTPVLELVEPRAEDAGTRTRYYERQLCLDVNDLARLLGPAVVASAAFTGSDPYLRMGSDVAVLFEARSPEVLKGYLEVKHAAALKSHPTTQRSEGEAGGLRYFAAVSPDRAVSSYVTVHGSTVVVTNSLVQLRRLGDAIAGRSQTLTSSDEYVFFRNRYLCGAEDEKGFLILTDATIRRWCGPVWRIGDSRRTRAAAALAELTARNLAAIAAGTVVEGTISTDLSIPGGGEIKLTLRGPVSSTYGSLEFLTPIAELAIEKVTGAEAEAYERFRRSYQQNWRRYFDPIAVRFALGKGRVGLDLSVMPLIAGTEYADLIDFTHGTSLAASAGDPHPETLLHVVLGVNPQSRALQQLASWGSHFPMLRSNPLGWIGGSVAVYIDSNPVWERLSPDNESAWGFLPFPPESPLAVHVESKDAPGLTAFLIGLRAFIEGSAPGMIAWETRTHRDRPYVRISFSESGKAQGGFAGQVRDLAVYYATGSRGLTATFSEAVIQRALDRWAEREKPQDGAAPPPWLGKHVGVRADTKLLQVFAALFGDFYRNVVQARAWNNIPILNEWKRNFPAEDPVKLHERLWGSRLRCPGGGTYVWNNEVGTMESTVYGHPGSPKPGPDLPPSVARLKSAAFGLTFEDRGLRARVEIEREAAEH